MSPPVKGFWKWLAFGDVTGKSLVYLFLTHGVYRTKYAWTVTILAAVTICSADCRYLEQVDIIL